MTHILTALEDILAERKGANSDSSYVAKLHAKGLNKILEKVGEEAFETVLAARDLQQQPSAERQQALVGEVADLWFHSMVMLSHLNVRHEEVLAVLETRFGLSGLVEKASRGQESS